MEFHRCNSTKSCWNPGSVLFVWVSTVSPKNHCHWPLWIQRTPTKNLKTISSFAIVNINRSKHYFVPLSGVFWRWKTHTTPSNTLYSLQCIWQRWRYVFIRSNRPPAPAPVPPPPPPRTFLPRLPVLTRSLSCRTWDMVSDTMASCCVTNIRLQPNIPTPVWISCWVGHLLYKANPTL